MKRFLLSLLAIVALSGLAKAQDIKDPVPVGLFGTTPGSCTAGQRPVVYNGGVYVCVSGSYTALGTGSGSGTIGGSIAANQVAYGSGVNAIQGSANLTFDGTTGLIVKASDAEYSTKPLRIQNSSGTSLMTLTADGRVFVGADTGNSGHLVITKPSATGLDMLILKDLSVTGTPQVSFTAGKDTFIIQAASGSTSFSFGASTTNNQILFVDPASNDGRVGIGTAPNFIGSRPQATFEIRNTTTTTIGQIIKLAHSQSADGWQLQDSSANVLTSFSSSGNLDFGSGILARWSSTSVSGGSKDLGLARNAAGVLEINNGTAGTYRDLRVRYLGVGAPPSSSNPFYAYTNDSSLSGTSILAKFEQLGTVTGNQTSYQIAIYGSMKTQAISAGITDSGYRRGFQLDMFLNTASFAGTLQEQTAGYANIGIYTATAGAVLNSSYGYRVVGHNNTASTTVSLLYGFHSNLVGATAGTVTTRHNFFVPDSVVANGTGQSGLTIGVLSGATNNTHLLLGTTTIPSGTYGAYIVSSAATAIPLTIKLAASQSADALQVQNSSATVLSSFTKDGYLNVLVPGSATTPAFAINSADTGFYWQNTSISVLTATIGGTSSGAGFFNSGIVLGNNKIIKWSTNANPSSGTYELGLYDNGSGVLEINNGTAGTYRDLILRNAGFSTAPTTNYTIDTNGSLAGNASQQGGARINWTSTGTNTYSSIGRGIDVLYVSGAIDSATNYNGIYVLPQLAAGTTTVTNVTGIQTYTGYGYTTNANSVTNAIGVLVKSWGNIVPALAFTNQAGLAIGALTGATNNVHLLLGTTTIPSGNFGAYIVSSAAAAIPLTIKGAASQSGNNINITNSSSQSLFVVDAYGSLTIQPQDTSQNAFINLYAPGTARQAGINFSSNGNSSFFQQDQGGNMVFRQNTAGSIYFDYQTQVWFRSGGGSANTHRFTPTGIAVGSTSVLAFTQSTNAGDTIDAALYRNGVGIIEFNNGVAGTYRDWRARAAGLGAAPVSGTQTIIITPSATTEIPVLIKQIASQTAKSFDIQTSGGTSLTSFDFNGNFIAGPSTIETFTVNGSAIGATLNYYTDSQTIYYDTANAANDVTLNIDASASVDLNTRLATNQVVTVVVKVTNGGTAYKISAVQIHGTTTGVTLYWPSGTAPSGNINSIDTYVFEVYKTAASTYKVFGRQDTHK